MAMHGAVPLKKWHNGSRAYDARVAQMWVKIAGNIFRPEDLLNAGDKFFLTFFSQKQFLTLNDTQRAIDCKTGGFSLLSSSVTNYYNQFLYITQSRAEN